jgi:hypothetical protein
MLPAQKILYVIIKFNLEVGKSYQVLLSLQKKKKNLLHSLGLVLQIYEGHDDQLNRPGPMA